MTFKIIIGKLKEQKLIREQKIYCDQIKKLATKAKKDLRSAKLGIKIDEEITYTYAYLAMLRSARALMFLYGFRPIGGRQHKTVIEFSSAIMDKKFAKLIDKFDRMRKKRNQLTYSPEQPVSLYEAKNALITAREFIDIIFKLIEKKDPQMKLF